MTKTQLVPIASMITLGIIIFFEGLGLSVQPAVLLGITTFTALAGWGALVKEGRRNQTLRAEKREIARKYYRAHKAKSG